MDIYIITKDGKVIGVTISASIASDMSYDNKAHVEQWDLDMDVFSDPNEETGDGKKLYRRDTKKKKELPG